MKPFLKWVGSKQSLQKTIQPCIPIGLECYVEPFLGSGATLLETMYRDKAKVYLGGDINQKLMKTWLDIKDNPEETQELTLKLSQGMTKEKYLELRDEFNKHPKKVAPYFLVLNAYSFRGMYRENSKGHFNVPYGDRKKVNFPEYTVYSQLMNKYALFLLTMNYQNVVYCSGENVLYYLDPPYYGTFEGYHKDSKENLNELKKYCDRINWLGSKFLLSNSNSIEVKECFSEYNILEIDVNRGIGSRKVKEVLISNYELPI